ncbi:MAG TPA: RagB/SusD family nutrient uptake outer membrane protein [Cyclobacteriaceae bacterium]|nr:RagB/SusD family nutrient uptake outer membrane protein [Cyclobacteriaceae bacterium]
MITNIKVKGGRLIPFMMVGFFMAACSLDIEETDSKITEGGSAVFNGITNVGSTLDNIYNDIRGQAESQENLYSLTEVSTDELLVPTRGTDWGDNGIWRTVHVHTWGPTHNHVVNVWNEKNSAVLRCSEIIDPLTTAASAAQRAEAKFARAYNMWIVMDFWGQVPFRNPSDGPDVVPDVMTRAEAYAMIVKDLTEAIADLPASNPASTNKTRPVKATARFLLAKVKLNANVYLGQYGANDLADVISLVDQIQAEGYALTGPGTYFDIFKGQNSFNTDVIWNVTASTGNRMWNGLHYNQGHPDNTGGGWNGFSTLAEFYNKFEGPSATNVIGGAQEERRGYTHTLATTTSTNGGFGYGFQLGTMYGWRYNGLNGSESAATVKDDNGNVIDAVGHVVTIKNRAGQPLSFTKEFPGLVGNNDVTGMRLLKYSPANGGFASGVVMARFADAYLMRAEAKLRSGNTGGALADVNALRALRGQTTALATMSEAVMLDERGRELYTEGWRRNDMIRFGVFNAAKEFKGATDAHVNLFPIPSSALLSNPGLVQNTGY